MTKQDPTLSACSESESTKCTPNTRILVIMPAIPLHGMERANLQVMKLLKDRGATICFVLEGNHGQAVIEQVQKMGFEWMPISLLDSYKDRLHLSKNPREMLGVLKCWLRAAWQIDSIYRKFRPTHIYLTSFDFFFYSVFTLLRSRVPVVFRVPNPPDSQLKGRKGQLYKFLWKSYIIPVCDAIVTNSIHTLQQLNAFGVNQKKLFLIRNTVPDRSFEDYRDAPSLSKDSFNIVFVGRITAGKGAGKLIQAAERIVMETPHVNFYLAGEYCWNNPFAEKLIQYVKQKNLDHRIRFLGYINDIPGLLKQCHLHVLPSMTESFPNVILEAKAAGLPSVVFPSGGIPEAVEHLTNGYICKENTADCLYEGLRYFIDHQDHCRETGKRALASLESFNSNRIASQWVNLLKELLHP